MSDEARHLAPFHQNTMHPMSKQAKPNKLDELVTALSRTPVFRVLLLANLIGRPFVEQFGKQYNMTLNEWRIMIAIASNPGVSISGICDKSGLHIMNVSRGVKGLERHGRVRKKIDPADRRRSVLELTDDGAVLFQEIATEGMKWADEICSALNSEETELLNALLKRMIRRIQRVTEPQVEMAPENRESS